MRHPRVRRPFIVESRGNSRENGSVAIPKRVPPAPSAQSKATVEATRPFFDPWAAVTAPPEPPAATRRILPNIMAPPEPEAEAPATDGFDREAPLPRVRRVKARSTAPTPRPAAPAEAPAAPRSQPVMVVERKPEAATASPALRTPLRSDRTGRAALPAGQRWKARLPRACW